MTGIPVYGLRSRRVKLSCIMDTSATIYTVEIQNNTYIMYQYMKEKNMLKKKIC